MAGIGAQGHVGPGGVWTPLQAESVVITISDSYAIMESVEDMEKQMIRAAQDAPHADTVFVTVHPKEGGRAILNVKHIVGFVSQGGEGNA